MATADARLGQYLIQVNGLVAARNESGLSRFIVLEPPFESGHQGLIEELRNVYPKGKEAALEQKCTHLLTAAVEGDEGGSWTSFVKFMLQYLNYLRDVSADASQYLQTYELLSELQQRANSALSHSTLGHLILPVVIVNAKLVCRLAIGLDKQPSLIAHLRSAQPGGGGDEGTSRETLPERAANILRGAFVTCLNDRATEVLPGTKPSGKKRGIYIIANLCLKILFQCHKTRNATQLFENIYNQSPPLSSYPKRDRVTFLYYLGRFLFQNSHFFRAAQALEAAYAEAPAHPACLNQRRHLLIYLTASNLILGRFPTPTLLSRPEAHGFRERFLPLCLAIRSGNLAAFHTHLDLAGPHAAWFLHFRILLQLRNRCEPLVWRSLVRKTWNIVGVRAVPGSKAAANCCISELATAFSILSAPPTTTSSDDDDDGEDATDPDFADIDYASPSSSDAESREAEEVLGVQSKLSSLIDQGLVSGFISLRTGRFAIRGAARHDHDALVAGFPKPYGVLTGRARAAGEDVVPGWKREGVPAKGMGGVVRLSGVREIGAV